MPRRDGTGPAGRGMGLCNAVKVVSTVGGVGIGLGCRKGFRRNGFSNTINLENEEEILMEQKNILENRLNLINNKLSDLQDNK